MSFESLPTIGYHLNNMQLNFHSQIYVHAKDFSQEVKISSQAAPLPYPGKGREGNRLNRHLYIGGTIMLIYRQ